MTVNDAISIVRLKGSFDPLGQVAAGCILASEIERLRAAILEFLRWENECEHNDAEWLDATERLAEAAEEGEKHDG